MSFDFPKYHVCSLSRRCYSRPVSPKYISLLLLTLVSCSSHLRASIWFSCNLLLAHSSVYITILIPSLSLSKCEGHLTVFVGENTEHSLSIKPRLRFVPVGIVEAVDMHDNIAQFAAMEKELPAVLGQLLSTSPSANGFLRRPSLSFVNVTLPS